MSYAGSYPFSVVQSSTAAATATGWMSRAKFAKEAQLAGSIGAYPFSGTTNNFAASTSVVPGEVMHLGIVDSNRDMDLVMKYLKTLGQTRILSNPKLVVVNNQEAKIHIGEKQAYVTTTTTAGQATSTIAEEVNFVDVGIQLSVTPNINDDGYITMKVKPEISSVSSVLITPTNNKIPIIDTSLTETTVMMKDATTLIIGGLRKEEKTSSSEGLPLVGRIPFLGNLFKSATFKTERTELIVMMTPHIISGKEFATGDEREFGHVPGKDYRPYQSIVPETEMTKPEIEPKPYRDYLSLKKDDDFPIKE
jgi:type II secretory pathway component GspD/PulD (secretin)